MPSKTSFSILIYLLSFLALSSILFSTVTSVIKDLPENIKVDRKTKLVSCIKLYIALIEDDKQYVGLSLPKFYPDLKTKKFEELFYGYKNKLLLTCSGQITLIQAAKIAGATKRTLNPYTSENKKLVDPEEHINKYNGNYNKYEKDLETLDYMSTLIPREITQFEELVATRLEPFVYTIEDRTTYQKKSKKAFNENHKAKNEEEENKSNDNDSPNSGTYLDEDGYSNLNLGMDMNNNTKNMLGFVLLILIIGGMLWSYKYIMGSMNFNAQNVSKKKKKNKNKNKEEKEEKEE